MVMWMRQMPFRRAIHLFAEDFDYKIHSMLNAPELVRTAKAATISKLSDIGPIDCFLLYAAMCVTLKLCRTTSRVVMDCRRLYNVKQQYSHEY